MRISIKIRMIFEKTYNKIKLYLRIIEKPIFAALLNLVMLIVAIYSLKVAQNTLKNADDQFYINSHQSDSLFNTQLNYSRSLNDSIVNQIKELQKITNQQLITTDKQLMISTKTLDEYIYSGRPKLLYIDSSIEDSSIIENNIYKPKIISHFRNNGKRFALHFSIRPFLVYNNFSLIEGSLDPKENVIIEPDKIFAYHFLTSMPINFKYDFYYCFDIQYYDDATNKEYNQAYYLQYSRKGKDNLFSFCKEDIQSKLKKSINNELTKRKLRLFDN